MKSWLKRLQLTFLVLNLLSTCRRLCTFTLVSSSKNTIHKDVWHYCEARLKTRKQEIQLCKMCLTQPYEWTLVILTCWEMEHILCCVCLWVLLWQCWKNAPVPIIVWQLVKEHNIWWTLQNSTKSGNISNERHPFKGFLLSRIPYSMHSIID